MNTSISSKLSLYDILAMLIPGALIICWISLIFCDNSLIIDKKKIDPLIFGILFSAGSYLVGIIYCKIIEWIWKDPVCPLLLSLFGFVIFVCLCCNSIEKNLIVLFIVFIILTIICLYKKKYLAIFFSIFLKLLERNNSTMIKKAYNHVQCDIFKNIRSNLLPLIKLPSTPAKGYPYFGILGSVDHYYQAYAFVAKNTYRNDIHTLESQFAFLRSMFGVILLFLYSLAIEHFRQTITILLDECHICIIALLLFFILVAIPFVMACIQKKIYEMVWEDYEYLNRVI